MALSLTLRNPQARPVEVCGVDYVRILEFNNYALDLDARFSLAPARAADIPKQRRYENRPV